MPQQAKVAVVQRQSVLKRCLKENSSDMGSIPSSSKNPGCSIIVQDFQGRRLRKIVDKKECLFKSRLPRWGAA